MSAKKRSMPDLQDRVDELVVWARSRIEHCRREEQKFGAGSVAIDASQERRTLEAVLRILHQENPWRVLFWHAESDCYFEEWGEEAIASAWEHNDGLLSDVTGIELHETLYRTRQSCLGEREEP